MTLAPATSPAPLLSSRRLRRILWWAGGLFAAFVAAGFLVVPPLAKPILEDQLGEALRRKVSIESLALNPFALVADVSGLTVRAEDGEVMGFDRLHVDVEAASLLEGGLVIRELRLEGPRLQVTRLSPERYDISDLIDEWSQPSEGPSPRFAVSNIQVSGGKAVLVDKPKGATHTVSDLALQLPFLSSQPYHAEIFVEPNFSARIDGAPLVLAGRSKPFADSHESELNLDLDQVELSRYLPYLPVQLPLVVAGGRLDTELKLVFRQNQDRPAALKLVGALHVTDLDLRESDGKPLLAWKKLDMMVGEADLLKGRYLIDRVRLSGIDSHVRIDSEGRLNWADLAGHLSGPGPSQPSRGKSALAWSVGEILVENGTLRYRDERHPSLPVQAVDHIDGRIGGLSSDAGKKLAVSLAARATGSATIKIGGDIRLQPFASSLDVDVQGLSILPFQPYFGERLNLILTRGQLSGQGRLDLAEGKEGLDGGFKGHATLGDLHSVDKANRADFLKWKSLFAGAIDARLRPFALKVGEVALSDFYARLIVGSQGQLNLMQIVRSPAAEVAADGAAESKPAAEKGPIQIGKVSLQGGTVNFSDYFVQPNYTVNVTRIGGRVTGLSSAPGTVADLELRGSYGNAAPVEVVAKLNPLAVKAYLDLKGEIRGVDLTTLSTYSGKYAGYAIDKGKLSLYVTYKLEDQLLVADNRVFLDQLTFGDKVDSPDATGLPVKLAVALLQNSRGEIDVNLPVSGSIDDPEFSLGGVIVRVMANLFVKAVTSPFALLGSLFGNGEELSSVDFEAGRAAVGAEATRRLQALARAMGERPGLKLEITGRADLEADREGLKRAALEQAVKAEKLKDLRKGAEVNLLDGIVIHLSPLEYPVYLRRAYQAAGFPKPRNLVGLQKELPVEEMEKLMLANLPVTEDHLRQLAQRRAEAVQAWLVEQGKVPMERLFLLPPKLVGDGKAAPSRVDFSLR